MDYILGKKPAGCIFCDFHQRTGAELRDNLVLLVQPHAFVCLNKYPFASSHLLVVPRKHVSSLDELSGEEYAAFNELLRATVARLRDTVKAEGMNVGFNLGKSAGAGIAEHLHAHLVPRWEGDMNFMPVIASTKVMPEYLDDVFRRLYPAFADLPGVRAPNP
jgi:ATP adenylyltransferase